MKIHLTKEYFEKSNSYYDNCVDCGKCVKCCPIIEKEGRSPKEFLDDLRKPSDIEFVDSISCLSCGYCKAVCPKSVDIGELLYDLKKINVKYNTDRKYRKKYRVIESHQKNSFRKILINGSKSKRVFFPGCSLSGANPNLVKETSKVLKKDGIGLFSGCCASPSSISGDINLFNKNIDIIKLEFKKRGVEEVIVACSNCYMSLKDIEGIKVTSIYNVLEEGNFIDENQIIESNDKYLLHDPCPTRFEDEIHESARNLLKKSGIDFKEFADNRKNTSCCGDGSMVSVLNTDMSQIQLMKRVEEAKETKILSYCQSCVNNFKSQNNDSKHILELLIKNDTNKLKDSTTLKKWANRYMISKYVSELK